MNNRYKNGGYSFIQKMKDLYVNQHYELLFKSLEHKPFKINNEILICHWDMEMEVWSISWNNSSGGDDVPSKTFYIKYKLFYYVKR